MPAELAALIDGVAIARDVRDDVAREVASLVAQGVRPGLAVVLVGDDPASAVYVRSKGKATEEAGMHGETIKLPAETTQAELLSLVDRLNADDTIHGILIQSPLPKHIDYQSVIARMKPEKDVDGFHPINAGKLLIGDRTGFAPCTPAGVMEMLKRKSVEVKGAECVIVGRSTIVGRPMAALMIQDDATVTVCHSKTKDLASHTRRADILIAAIGRPRFITGDMIRPGAVVIDVGINRVNDSRAKQGYVLVGDVDFPSTSEVASLITPVPGGVGPMTIAMLMKNTVRAAAMTVQAGHRQ